MEINIRKAVKSDYPAMVEIWNEVVEDGIAFPQLDLLDENSGAEFSVHKHIVRLRKIPKATKF